MQLMFPEGDWKVLWDACCATVVGTGTGTGAEVGAGVTVTVTVGTADGVDAAGVGCDGEVAVDPTVDEHPATASATSHAALRRSARRGASRRFSVMREGFATAGEALEDS
jgi:hypothetical protein